MVSRLQRVNYLKLRATKGNCYLRTGRKRIFLDFSSAGLDLFSNLQKVEDIDVVALLYEPQPVKVGDDRLTFVGHKEHAVDVTARQVRQVWLMKPYD